MNSAYHSRACVALILVTFGGAVPAAGVPDDTPLSFRFSETLRVREQQTVVERTNGSLTEHVSSEAGTVRLDAAIPLSGDLALDPSTPVVVTAGNLTLRSTLSADPSYRVGMRRANILLTVPSGSGKNSVAYGHEMIRWTRNRLTIHVEGSIPALTPICARDFLTSPLHGADTQTQPLTPGEQGQDRIPRDKATVFANANMGETRAYVEVGAIRATSRVIFQVKKSTRTVAGGPYVDSGIKWRFLTTSPGEMDAGRRTAVESTIKVTGSASDSPPTLRSYR